jgi:hypothetical protein
LNLLEVRNFGGGIVVSIVEGNRPSDSLSPEQLRFLVKTNTDKNGPETGKW